MLNVKKGNIKFDFSNEDIFENYCFETFTEGCCFSLIFKYTV